MWTCLCFYAYYCMHVIGQADTGREWHGIYNVCSGGQRCCWSALLPWLRWKYDRNLQLQQKTTTTWKYHSGVLQFILLACTNRSMTRSGSICNNNNNDYSSFLFHSNCLPQIPSLTRKFATTTQVFTQLVAAPWAWFVAQNFNPIVSRWVIKSHACFLTRILQYCSGFCSSSCLLQTVPNIWMYGIHVRRLQLFS